MSVVFVWEEKYAVGVPELDKHHRFLFDFGNTIQNIDKSQVKSSVMELYKYANAHFKAEETHMVAIGFPDADRHKKLHEKFITDLNTLTSDYRDDFMEKLISFLHTWLIDHVLNEDNKYFVFANENQ